MLDSDLARIYKCSNGTKTINQAVNRHLDRFPDDFCFKLSEDEFKRLGLRKGYYKLKHPTDQNVDISLIKKRPFVGDRNDYGEKEYLDMSFDDEDMYLIIKVQNSNPIYGSYYKKQKKIKKPR